MDKINPDISVFTSVPNNGYYALVFTDSGMIMSANCSKKDAYEGLLGACARFLLDCIDNEKPHFNLLTSHELNPEEKSQIDRYTKLIESVHDTFCKELKSRLAIDSTTKQLESVGLPHIFAKILATSMEVFPGNSKKELIDEDASDDEDSLD